MTKVYLASWFASLPIIRQRAEELRANGIDVTSRWLEEKVKPTVQIQDVEDDYLRETAMIDIHDILIADTLVLNVPSTEDLKTYNLPLSNWARGGRQFEAGFHYATMMFLAYLPQSIQDRGPRQMLLVGHKENVFHYLDGILPSKADNIPLPTITTFETWEEAKNYLIAKSVEVAVTH
jgi:hypothetical protein